jgi:hypothetical protein
VSCLQLSPLPGVIPLGNVKKVCQGFYPWETFNATAEFFWLHALYLEKSNYGENNFHSLHYCNIIFSHSLHFKQKSNKLFTFKIIHKISTYFYHFYSIFFQCLKRLLIYFSDFFKFGVLFYNLLLISLCNLLLTHFF